MPIEKIKTGVASLIIAGIYLSVAALLFKEQAEKRVNFYECPLCGQLVQK